MTTKVKNSLNASAFPKNYEVNEMPSLTVPDQTLSIREIMTRYAHGLPLEGARVPIYDEDDEMPDPRHLDLAERQELTELYMQEIESIKRRHSKKKAPTGGAEALAGYTGEGQQGDGGGGTEQAGASEEQPDNPANL